MSGQKGEKDGRREPRPVASVNQAGRLEELAEEAGICQS